MHMQAQARRFEKCVRRPIVSTCRHERSASFQATKVQKSPTSYGRSGAFKTFTNAVFGSRGLCFVVFRSRSETEPVNRASAGIILVHKARSLVRFGAQRVLQIYRAPQSQLTLTAGGSKTCM